MEPHCIHFTHLVTESRKVTVRKQTTLEKLHTTQYNFSVLYASPNCYMHELKSKRSYDAAKYRQLWNGQCC